MAQSGQGSGAAPPLIKPSQVDGLPFLTLEQKSHYKTGLANLWRELEHSRRNGQAHREAETSSKIRAASVKIVQQGQKVQQAISNTAVGTRHKSGRDRESDLIIL